MIRFLYDTSIFIYAVGRDHPYRDPCRRILDLAGAGLLRGEASADLVQEVLHQRHRRTGDRELAAGQARRAAGLCQLHEVRPEDVGGAILLFEAHQRLNARDSVFAAVALNRGIDTILSPDRGFDQIDGLRRVDPADTEGVDSLLVDPVEGR